MYSAGYLQYLEEAIIVAVLFSQLLSGACWGSKLGVGARQGAGADILSVSFTSGVRRMRTEYTSLEVKISMCYTNRMPPNLTFLHMLSIYGKLGRDSMDLIRGEKRTPQRVLTPTPGALEPGAFCTLNGQKWTSTTTYPCSRVDPVLAGSSRYLTSGLNPADLPGILFLITTDMQACREIIRPLMILRYFDWAFR